MTEFQYTPDELKSINDAVEECVKSLEREENEKSFRKDVVSRMGDELKMKSAEFNALVKERYNSTSTKAIEKHEEIADFNEKLISSAKKTVSAPVSS